VREARERHAEFQAGRARELTEERSLGERLVALRGSAVELRVDVRDQLRLLEHSRSRANLKIAKGGDAAKELRKIRACVERIEAQIRDRLEQLREAA
jgi:hypothetical protein